MSIPLAVIAYRKVKHSNILAAYTGQNALMRTGLGLGAGLGIIALANLPE